MTRDASHSAGNSAAAMISKPAEQRAVERMCSPSAERRSDRDHQEQQQRKLGLEAHARRSGAARGAQIESFQAAVQAWRDSPRLCAARLMLPPASRKLASSTSRLKMLRSRAAPRGAVPADSDRPRPRCCREPAVWRVRWNCAVRAHCPASRAAAGQSPHRRSIANRGRENAGPAAICRPAGPPAPAPRYR